MSDTATRTRRVRNVVERLDALTDAERLSLGDIVEAFGRTAFLPLLLVPALLVISPLSGIPFFSSICGLTIALIALQLVLRRQSLWLPGVLMRRTISGERVHAGAERLKGFADWLDRRARDRLSFLTYAPLSTVVQAACMACGLAMPFLEVVPFSSSILGTAVVMFVVALLAHDGLFVILGGTLMAVAAVIPLTVLDRLLGG
ncbi:exopolysaccharide biosynthesis protein [Rhodobacteraceae bacterium CCMM004]|nr:exopolysaccharide biosynthesis protein [Rhodobacteraceae bacterium CCMM004]